MKKQSFLVVLMLLMTAHLSAQKQLNNFDELMESLKSGKEVKAVFHYGQCQLISDNEISKDSIDAIGGMPISTWEYFAPMAVYNKQAFLVASESKLIRNPLADEGFVYNYVKVKIYADNSVKITAKYVDAQTMEEVMTENFFGTINDGDNEQGIYFYEL
jgi:hypothetical protein